MQNDRLLYRLLFSCMALLLVVAVALPAVMQGDTGTAEPIPNDAFEMTGILDSITNQEIVVDGIPVDIRVADLNTRLTLGDVVRVEGTLNAGIFTAREVGPAASPFPAATPEVRASNESSGISDDEDDNFEFRGIIESVDDAFVIVSGRRVETANTEIEAQLVVGQLVKVEGRLQSGIFTAREIELPDDDGFFNDDDDDFDDIFDDDDDLSIPADCTVNAPAGWVSYTIRSGESLSSIAARSSSRISELVRVNCLGDPRVIIAGSSLLLPRMPTSFPGTRGGNESSGSRSQNFPNNPEGGNESSGSSSRSFSTSSSGGNESSGSNSASNSASNSGSGS